MDITDDMLYTIIKNSTEDSYDFIKKYFVTERSMIKLSEKLTKHDEYDKYRNRNIYQFIEFLNKEKNVSVSFTRNIFNISYEFIFGNNQEDEIKMKYSIKKGLLTIKSKLKPSPSISKVVDLLEEEGVVTTNFDVMVTNVVEAESK